MDALIAKSIAAQWDAVEDIDWSLDVKRPLWFRRQTYIRMISQLYHGELATQRLCRKLQAESDDPEIKQFVALQLADEQRHEQVFKRYLERLGDIAPIEESMEMALEKSFASPGSHLGLIVAFHVVFEGGALKIIDHLTKRLPCQLFRSINAKVLPDEARHVAFGTRYLRERVATLSLSERQDIYEWVRNLWNECHGRQRRGFNLPAVLATGLQSDWLEESWQDQSLLLRSLGLGENQTGVMTNK